MMYKTLIPIIDELCGERVIVRSLQEADAEALYEAMEESRDYLRPWLSFADAHESVDAARSFIVYCIADGLCRNGFKFHLWDRETERFLGGAWINPHDWEVGYFEFGYWLRPSAAGHGYTTEAIRLLADYAFRVWNAKRLEIRCDEYNERSIAVAKRLGFTLEGRLRNMELDVDGNLRTMLVFSMIPEERGQSH